MITEYEKFRMQDQKGEKDWFIEVNWDDTEEVKDCKILKITFPNGDIAYTKREYLNTMLFAIGTSQDQQKLIPQRLTKARWYETVVSVRAKRNIEKGDNITFPIKLTLPLVEEEVIG